MGMENEYDLAERVKKQFKRDRENFDEGYRVGYREGYNKAKDERPQGEWVRKEDVIHSIAKQYSEHNELVPIWLSIGDIKGGAENEKTI